MHEEDIVDLGRYPVDALNSPEGQSLIAHCREELDSVALCTLPGFVRHDALQAMAREVDALSRYAHMLDTMRVAYAENDAKKWPSDHPRSIAHRCRYGQILNDDIPSESLIGRLYRWPVLTEFVRQALGEETLYISACPHLGLTAQVSQSGDSNGWHYDSNDYVVSLLLQPADEGGEFEYAPYIRTTTDERYDAVAELFADPNRHGERRSLTAGTFTLFKGDLSLHRVRTVGATEKKRLIALFSYDCDQDQVFSTDYVTFVKQHRRLGDVSA